MPLEKKMSASFSQQTHKLDRIYSTRHFQTYTKIKLRHMLFDYQHNFFSNYLSNFHMHV